MAASYKDDILSSGTDSEEEAVEDAVLAEVRVWETNGTLEDTSSSSKSAESTEVSPIMSARAYQQEMLEASLKRNIIVAVRQNDPCSIYS